MTNIMTRRLERLDEMIERGFQILVFSIPLAFLQLSYGWVDLVKFTLLQLEVLFVLACWALKQLAAQEIQFVRTKLDLLVLIFLGTTGLSAATSIHIPTSIFGKYFRYEGFVTIFYYTLLFLLTTQFFGKTQANSGTKLRSLQNIMILAATSISIYGLLQYFGFDFVNWGKPPFELNKSFATLGNPILLAGYLVLMLPIILSCYLRASKPRQYLAYGVSFLLSLACLITTFSRSGWIAFVIGISVTYLLLGKKVVFSRRTGLLFLTIAFLILVLFVSNYLAPPVPSPSVSLPERIVSITRPGEGSIGARLEIWKSAFRMIAQRPLLGWGSDTFTLAYPPFATFRYVQLAGYRSLPESAFNYFLQLASEQGFLGLASFVAIMIFLLWHGLKFLRHQPANLDKVLLAGLLASVMGYLVHLQTSINVIGSGTIFWIIVGLISVHSEKVSLYRLSLRKEYLMRRLILIVLICLIVLGGSYLALRFYLADINFARAQRASTSGYSEVMVKSHYLSAIRLNPYESLYQRSLGRFYADSASRLESQLFFEKAVAIYKKAQRTGPYEIGNYVLLGNLYLWEAEWASPRYYKLAERELLYARRLYSYQADARGNLGIIYLESGQIQKALQEFQAVAKIIPRDAQSYFYIGQSYQALGDRKKAIKAYRKALELNPLYRKAAEALMRLL